MNRRQVLGSAASMAVGGIASCLGAPVESTEESTSDTTPTETAQTSESPEPIPSRRQRGQTEVEIHPRKSEYFNDNIAAIRCTCVAADAVGAYVYDQLEDTDGLGYGCGRSPALFTRFEVKVFHTTYYGRDGELLGTPAVEFERLLAETPRTASATIESRDRVHSCKVPVYVVHENAHVD